MDSINLKKIAQVLGLSISTVSRALKNHPDISAITKRRVMETAESLNYVPNLNAVNLRSRNSRVFGVMVPSISNTFYVSFIDAVEEEARRNGYSLMILQSSDKAETELENIQIYRQNRIMGLFACITPNTEKLESFMNLKELNIPVLFFDKVPDLEHCNKVCLDDEGAGILAAETLLKYHKKNILALFGNEKISITRSRLKAFKGVFETSKDVSVAIEYALSSSEAQNISRQYFSRKNRPDAVFCMSDEVLIGVMKTIQELGIRYPADMGIIAISEGFFPKIFYPEITYVETSGYKLGKICFEKMNHLVKKNDVENTLNVPTLLVEGGSM